MRFIAHFDLHLKAFVRVHPKEKEREKELAITKLMERIRGSFQLVHCFIFIMFFLLSAIHLLTPRHNVLSRKEWTLKVSSSQFMCQVLCIKSSQMKAH